MSMRKVKSGTLRTPSAVLVTCQAVAVRSGVKFWRRREWKPGYRQSQMKKAAGLAAFPSNVLVSNRNQTSRSETWLRRR